MKDTLDRNSFENMFKTYFVPLSNFAFGIVGDMDQAKDLVQQSFLKLWNKRESVDTSRSVKAYLYTSVRNYSINYLRDQKKFQSSILDVEVFDNSEYNADSREPLELLGNELALKIERILKHMPEKSREVFRMSRYEKMKYREIADHLDITVKTVEAHMSRALKILRTELKDYLLTFVLIFSLIRILLLFN